MPIDQTVLEKLKASHGEIFKVRRCDTDIYLRLPTAQEWEMFTDTAGENNAAGPLHVLVSACVVHPEQVEFQALYRTRPGIAANIGKEIAKLVGANEKGEAKKV